MPAAHKALTEGAHDPRETFQGRAGLRVHRRGQPGFTCCKRATANAPASRRSNSPVDMVRRKIDRLEERRSSASRPTQLDHLLAPIFDRKVDRKMRKQSRPVFLPARARRPARFISTPIDAAAARAERRKGFARPHRDVAGRFARHDRGRRNSHRARRCFVARRVGRATDGQGLRLRRRGIAH